MRRRRAAWGALALLTLPLEGGSHSPSQVLINAVRGEVNSPAKAGGSIGR